MKRAVVLMLALAGVLAAAPVSLALPTVGASANTIPAGAFMFDVWGIWQDYTTAYETDGDTQRWQSLDEGKTATSGSFVPRIYYGVTDWLTLRAALPLEDRYVEEADWDSGKSNTGLGDIIVDPKIRLTSGGNGFPRVSLLAGVRFSTGETDGADNTRVAPLSDGSTDYMIGSVLTQSSPPVSAHFCLTYWINGERVGGTRGDNAWVGLATLESDIDENWTLLWEFKGVFSESDTDYRRTYACPGIQWSGDRVTIGFSGLVSAAAKGGAGPGKYDFDWAPYIRIYYKLF
jgi:hypothetical protein